MNGTSGFQEVRSSTSRSSTNRMLREQRHQFGKGFWSLLRAHDLTTSRGIDTKQAKVVHTISASLTQAWRTQ